MNASKTAVVGDVAVDLHPFIRTYNDGRIERILRSTFVPASEDVAATRSAVVTRDVIIDEANGVSARLFLPSDAAAASDDGRRRRLPVVLYIHGGSFCTESAFCRTYHRYATSLASRAGVIVVSVEYRLAPEHPVPAAHDDAWAALRWAASPLSADPWLADHADPTRLFVAGDSAGGHIAYRTAVRASRNGVDIEGLVIIHPYFWGARMLPSEAAWDGGSVIRPETVESLWPFVTSGQSGNNDPLVDPSMDEIAGLTCRRALVAVAEKDFLRHRGLRLAARMRWAGGREVTVVESEGEDHGFHLYSPLRATSRRLMESIVQFINHRSESETASGWPAGVLPELHECAPLRACKGKVSRAQPLLSVPSRPYQGVFLNGLDLQARRGPRAMEINSSLTIGLRKMSNRGFGLFTARPKPNNCKASMGTLSASASVSSTTVGKNFL
uniref:Alpha/beta hydrolase fold-3 domain-containing protein n=1 Tax=Leersia perrieri TaxID=77586 RepID=A0A0D9WZN3_9ORYZ